MKHIAFIILLSILAGAGTAQSVKKESAILSCAITDTHVLSLYTQYSIYTDPGEYEYLYKNLPDSLPELCSLIKAQFIHPYSELPRYREQIPQERWNEAYRYPDVRTILKGLVTLDSAGIVNKRRPEARLVLGCNQNAILLASVMKYRGIPARVRSGHAAYIASGFHVSHTVCEVWNNKEARWMLVDPSMDMVDFNRELFDFSNELWLKLQKGEINPDLYGIPHRYTGLVSIVGKVCTDLASVLGTEYPIDRYAPVLDQIFQNDPLTREQVEVLNIISEEMMSIDEESLGKLKIIYESNPDFQITKTFQ